MSRRRRSHDEYDVNILSNVSNVALQILTKDSVTVFVNAIMYYKVKVYCTVLCYVLYCTTR